ncbi:hypothetical protein ABDK00_018335 [Niabella insulamsoli]|uniref:hypothetical protein n=1 Tax=Niabella insulamsoli TaxID=3144874 RepID=UPI0031FC4E9E
MKSLILSAALILTLSGTAFAGTVDPTNEKVMKTFTQIFKDAGNVSWSNAGNYFEAHFILDDIRTRATLDAKGNLVQTIRYFKEDQLPSNVLYHIKKTYQGKDVFGVTEVSNRNGVNYRVVLKDEKNYIHINANSYGESQLVKKFKRGDK